MKFVADLHVHTISSGHAYSTILEIVSAAAAKKLAMIAITDHGPAMPGAPCAYHFSNLAAVPDEISGVRVLKGIEANVINRDGALDLEHERLAKLDIVLAGLHTKCAPYGSVEENTAMMINTMKNPWVDVIVHPGNPEYPIDAEAVVRAAVEFDVALEVNNSSLTISRRGSKPQCDHIICLAKQYGAKLIAGTDSHFALSVGELQQAAALLEANGVGPEAVINTSFDKIEMHLARRSNRRK